MIVITPLRFDPQSKANRLGQLTSGQGRIDHKNRNFFAVHEATDKVVDETTARTDDYNERNSHLSGYFDNLTVEP